MDKYRREAMEQIPAGHYVLKPGDLLQASDLVWSWTSREFLRADSPDWLFPTLKIRVEDLVCAIRKIGLTEFEKQIPVKRVFTLKREVLKLDGEPKEEARTKQPNLFN